MRACIRCHQVKFWFQFTTVDLGTATGVLDVCHKCTRELGKLAAQDYEEEL